MQNKRKLNPKRLIIHHLSASIMIN